MGKGILSLVWKSSLEVRPVRAFLKVRVPSLAAVMVVSSTTKSTPSTTRWASFPGYLRKLLSRYFSMFRSLRSFISPLESREKVRCTLGTAVKAPTPPWTLNLSSTGQVSSSIDLR